MKMMFFLICCTGLIAGFYGMSCIDDPSGSAFQDSANPVSAATSRLPLGPIHNNFWNVKRPFRGGNWLGAIGYDEQGHAIFQDPAYGVRAAIRLLDNYQNRYNINTVAGIIERWAPANDGNRPAAYASKVCKDLGLKPSDVIPLFSAAGKIKDLDLLKKVMNSMAEYECGHGFQVKDDDFLRGLKLYQG